jgi:DNA helicase-2/ATP-dependent DNA helicase PcrA
MKVAVERGLPLWNVLPEAPGNGDLQHGVGERIDAFRKLIESFRARLGTEPLHALTTELVNTIDYRAELRRAYKETNEAEARWNSTEALINSIALYESRNENASLLGFLEETALAGRDEEKEDEKQPHALTLMTLHSAKGLEFPHVYMVGMEEGILPHARSIGPGGTIEEERRLCYVGVTRAQATLTLSFAKARMKWGKARPSIPSRFLMEMRGDTERAKRAAAAAEAMFAKLGAEGEAAEVDAGDGAGKRGASKSASGEGAAAKRQSSRARSSASKRASS